MTIPIRYPKTINHYDRSIDQSSQGWYGAEQLSGAAVCFAIAL